MYFAGILVYFQSLKSAFDTFFTFNYWKGNCCKSFKKLLNLAKMRTQDHNNAKWYVKNTASPSIISVAWMLCPIEMVKIKKSSFFLDFEKLKKFSEKSQRFLKKLPPHQFSSKLFGDSFLTLPMGIKIRNNYN